MSDGDSAPDGPPDLLLSRGPGCRKKLLYGLYLKQVEGEDYLISQVTNRDLFIFNIIFLPLFDMINLCLLCLFFPRTKSGFFTSFWLIV